MLNRPATLDFRRLYVCVVGARDLQLGGGGTLTVIVTTGAAKDCRAESEATQAVAAPSWQFETSLGVPAVGRPPRSAASDAEAMVQFSVHRRHFLATEVVGGATVQLSALLGASRPPTRHASNAPMIARARSAQIIARISSRCRWSSPQPPETSRLPPGQLRSTCAYSLPTTTPYARLPSAASPRTRRGPLLARRPETSAWRRTLGCRQALATSRSPRRPWAEPARATSVASLVASLVARLRRGVWSSRRGPTYRLRRLHRRRRTPTTRGCTASCSSSAPPGRSCRRSYRVLTSSTADRHMHVLYIALKAHRVRAAEPCKQTPVRGQ